MYQNILSALLFSTCLVTAMPAVAGSINALESPGGFPIFLPMLTTDGLKMVGTYDVSGSATGYIFSNGTVQNLANLAGGSFSNVWGMNGDASIIVGSSEYGSSGDVTAVYWANGAAPVDLGILVGDTLSVAQFVSSNGSVITGISTTGGPAQAVRWVNFGPIEALGFLPSGSASTPTGISDNGNVIIGYADNGVSSRAVRWVGNNPIEQLDMIVGHVESYANAVNGDGSVIVGSSNDGSVYHAVRWIGNNPVEALDETNLSTTVANFVSQDGSIILGRGTDTATATNQAVRWVGNGPAEILSKLDVSADVLIMGMNRDASVIVGKSSDGNGTYHAVRWVGNDPIESIDTFLSNNGVDLTNWTLESASGVSQDGQYIVGDGSRNGVGINFVANMVSGGVTTPADIIASVGSVSQATQAVTQSAAAQLGQTLFTARHMMTRFTAPAFKASPNELSQIGTAAGGAQRSAWELYTMGGFGIGAENDYDNTNFNGTIGVKRRVTQDFGIGAGILGSTSRNELIFNGQSDMDALGGSIVAAYEPDSGLRVYGSTFAADINMDITRGYTNGGSLDSSRGKTGGVAYGAAVQGGWSFPLNEKSSIMPYAEGRWSKTKLDAYNETGGAFAGSFSSQDQTNTSSRLGIEHNYNVTPSVDFTSRLAWGHRLSGNGKGVTATVGGLTQTMAGDAGDRDWAEAAVGATWRASPATTFAAELSGRSGETSEPQLGLVASASIAF